MKHLFCYIYDLNIYVRKVRTYINNIYVYIPYTRDPRGAREMTFGKTMIDALDIFDIDPKHWPAMAANRTSWHHKIKQYDNSNTKTRAIS